MVTTLSYFQLYPGLAVYDADGRKFGTVSDLRLLLASGELVRAARISGLVPTSSRCCAINGFLVVRQGWRRRRVMVPLGQLASVTDGGVMLASNSGQPAPVSR